MKKAFFALMMLFALVAACSSDDDDNTPKNNSNNNNVVESIDSDYTYELPVIFHVLYSSQSDQNQYIPYQRLANILSYVNQIYQGGIYGESENVHVRFVLATKDEDGKTLTHPGVEYVHYTGDYPIDPYTFMNDNTRANVKYIWDPNSYINVMMFNFKSTSDDEVTLGISHMPFTVEGDHALEGLETVEQTSLTKSNLRFAYCSAINSLYANLSSNGSYYQSDRYTNSNHEPTYLTSSDVVVTIAHELGHYLGLYHAFTESKSNTSSEPVDSCGDTDYCSDTKSYNRYEYLEYVKGLTTEEKNSANTLLRRNSCDGMEYLSANIMDYSLTLGYKISKEQVQRMRHVLNYSPLIPGPKLAQTPTTRASADDRPLNLKFRIIK